MRFSFIIPVYGTERFLPRCLDSILAQTERDFEIVVVDDCSPGDCAEIVKAYGDSVRYIRHEKNRSAFQARLTAVREAKGEYVVPLDPDDYITPELLERASALIARTCPDVVSYWIDYDDGRKVFPHWCRHAEAVISGIEAIRELGEGKFATGVATKILRRDLLLRAVALLPHAEEYYVNTSDDFLMLIPLLLLCDRVAFLEYAGYRYFMNEASTSFSWSGIDGLRKAVSQIGVVHDALRKVMVAQDWGDEARTDVEGLLGRMESWFAFNALRSPNLSADDVVDTLVRDFDPRNVAKGCAQAMTEIRASKAYRLVKCLAYVFRRIQRRWRSTDL